MVLSFSSCSADICHGVAARLQNALTDKGVFVSRVSVNTDDFSDSCERLALAKKATRLVVCPTFTLSDGCMLSCKDRSASNADVCAMYDGVFVVVRNACQLTAQEIAHASTLMCHPHFRMLSLTSLEADFDAFAAHIFSELTADIPREIENKYLIAMPEKADFDGVPTSHTDEIIQTYLVREKEDVQRRVRKRGNPIDGYTYTYTEKTKVINGARLENERVIDKQTYERLLNSADRHVPPIEKHRFCFVYNGQFFEMDTYPFDDTKAIVEIELSHVGQRVDFPNFLHLLADVTGDKRYKNKRLAKAQAFPDDV